MKCKLISAILLIAVGMLVLTSCIADMSDIISDMEERIVELEKELEEKIDSDDDDKNNGKNEVETLVIATGGPAGPYYAYGMAMAPVISNATDMRLDVQSTGGSKANIQLIHADEADIAMVQNDVMYYAYTGTDLFTGEQTQDFSALATLYPEPVQIIAMKDSGIITVADLIGKRVSVGDAGSGTEFNAKQILDACGIDMEKDIEKHNFDFGMSSDALKDGKIDAFFVVAGAPTPAILDLAISHEIVVVSIGDDVYNDLYNDYQFYTQQAIPKETYKGMTEDVKTVAVMATYIVDRDLDEETVYEFTKALFEKKDEIAEVHVKGEELNLETAINGIPQDVPIHPGAERYYREQGIIR